MCATCDADRFTDAELAEFAGESSPRFRQTVLRHAFGIVQRQLDIGARALAQLMGLSKTTVYRLIKGDGVTHASFLGYIQILESVRSKAHERTRRD
jgi:hypothetical protein